jgi:PAB-dependent poly(A)-specific ribonuclease subunit 3
MDALSSAFGGLSAGAGEWRPGQGAGGAGSSPSQEQQQQQQQQLQQQQRVNVNAHDSLSSGFAAAVSLPTFIPGVGLGPAEDPAAAAASAMGGGMGGDEQQPISTTTVAPPPPATPLANPRTLLSLGLPEDMWEHYRDLDMEASRQIAPDDPRHNAVPPTYVNAYPLDEDERLQPGISGRKRSSLGYPTSAFRVTSREDGRNYCLRRLDSVRCVSHKIAGTVRDAWINAVDPATGGGGRLIDHPNLVALYRAFVSQRAVFFVHRYHPGARTLRERVADPRHGWAGAMPEAAIWSIVSQLVGLTKSVHGANLAVRTLQLNHILCASEAGQGTVPSEAGRVRVRVNCVGIPDALEFEARKPLADLQREDMLALGRIILGLATGSELGPADSADDKTLGRCEAHMDRHYSPSLRNLAMALVRGPGGNPPTIYDVASRIGTRSFDELSAVQSTLDRVDECLATEYEAGRALRLLLKLGFVNERPEFGVDGRWSETGDNYVLKLFRDYVFHQADGGGRPVMDLGHVVTALNKLDAADPERIALASRDGKNVLVVSFADVARCLENAYGELCDGSVRPSTLLGGGVIGGAGGGGRGQGPAMGMGMGGGRPPTY